VYDAAVGTVARAWLVLALLVAPGVAPDAGAQAFDRPADERPELPPFGAAPAQPSLLPPPPDLAHVGPAPAPRFFVHGYRVLDCTVFSDAELARVLDPYNGREISSEELAEVRDALTRLYVDHGYVNSGALIPDQDMTDGIVEIQIVEGRLGAIRVSGQHWFREDRLRDRIAVGLSVPLDLPKLENNLQLLQQDPRIERVYARLLPSERVGEAVLMVRVEERSPYRLEVSTSNYDPVAFGGVRGQLRLGDDNVLGFGDAFDARLTVAHGLTRAEGRYEFPLDARGTVLQLRGEYSNSRVVEDPFDALDIETDYYAARIGVVHPLYRSPRGSVRAGLFFEWRRAETCFRALEDLIGCDPFDFVGAGAVSGTATVSVARFSTEWERLERNQVFAARSLLSVGLPVLGARSGGVFPDGRFVAWLGQFQWARRFEPWGVQAIFRTDAQLSNGALPNLEQFPVGGHASVRGYRENQLVRDEGVVASIELRLPVWRFEGRSIVELAPFFDFGYTNNLNRPTLEPDTLASVGVGLRLQPLPSVEAALYWGHQIESVPTSGNLQDDGIQFRVDWKPF
jgi:hemolysin activation/secretion protein